MTRSVPPAEGLLISPIKNGTVIDHITSGEALNVLKIIGITGTTTESVSVATNVSSSKTGKKDIVKIENRELCKEEMNRIALIAPHVSINIIREFKVFAKGGVERPKFLLGVVRCPNPGCITNAHEPVSSRFEVLPNGLHCMYCDWLITTDITGHMI
ncbi:MAG: aspartate carbamoyltransferase regulatory subunit [Methanomicrobiales archaeon]